MREVLAFDTPGDDQGAHRRATLEEAFIALLPAEQAARPSPRWSSRRASRDHEVAPSRRSDLTRRFGDFVAVDHVSFRIDRGEIFGFLGSNGCGKTTTMKMLTGLLPASEGQAWLLGKPVDARDLETRRRVGFMSQSFSLYTELTVRQNLDLHARLFHLPRGADRSARIAEMARAVRARRVPGRLWPRSFRSGVRQRLSLAVAVIHEPEMLILDEPTSGVDPVARDRFWELLIELSRNRGVTIFISTHFMNEAERCDRISLMHAGRVLAQGAPAEIVRDAARRRIWKRRSSAYIEQRQRGSRRSHRTAGRRCPPRHVRRRHSATPRASRTGPLQLRPALGLCQREATEIRARSDPAGLRAARADPADDRVRLRHLVRRREPLLRGARPGQLAREPRPTWRTSPARAISRSSRDCSTRPTWSAACAAASIKLAIEIPPGFGTRSQARALARGRRVAGRREAVPRRDQPRLCGRRAPGVPGGACAARSAPAAAGSSPATIEMRFRYNQDFRSVFAMVPGVIMMLLVMIPAMMTALGVVREKELGSITNFYVTPLTRAGVPARQAAALRRDRARQLPVLVLLALFLFRGAGQGQPALRSRWAPCCTSSRPPHSACSSRAS